MLAGIIYTLLLMPIIYPFLDVIDDFQVIHPYAPLLTLPIPAFLVYYYPHTEQWSTTHGDSAIFMTVGSGVSVGTWLNYQQGLMHPAAELSLLPVAMPGLAWFTVAFVRFAIGMVLVATVRFVMKPLTLWSICRLLGVDTKDTTTQRSMGLEVPHKFFSYFLVSITIVHTAPLLLSYIGVMREGYYTEI